MTRFLLYDDRAALFRDSQVDFFQRRAGSRPYGALQANTAKVERLKPMRTSKASYLDNGHKTKGIPLRSVASDQGAQFSSDLRYTANRHE